MDSPESIPALEVVHSASGRVRLRAPSRRGDADFFNNLGQSLLQLSGVREVRSSARTASLLVLFSGSEAALFEQMRDAQLLTFAPTPKGMPMLRLENAIVRADERVARETENALSLGALVFGGMVIAAFVQLRRGDFWPAGVTLLSYASQLLEHEAERERGLAKSS